MDPIALGDLKVAAKLPRYSARRALLGAPRTGETTYALAAAAVGLCWSDPVVKMPIRYVPGDGSIVVYGSAVLDFLVDEKGCNPDAVRDEGIRLFTAISDSLITQEEVDEALTPT